MHAQDFSEFGLGIRWRSCRGRTKHGGGRAGAVGGNVAVHRLAG